MMAHSAWGDVFTSSSRLQGLSKRELSLHKRIHPDRIYEIEDLITITFKFTKDGQKQVALKTINSVEIYFTCEEFDEFLSTFDCFNTHWVDSFSIIGFYTLVFFPNGEKRSLKFENAATDKYLFHWNDKLIELFSTHIYDLYDINCKW